MAALAALGTFVVQNLGTIATVASVAGAGIQAYGTIAAGKAEARAAEEQARNARSAANFEAAQLDMQAKNERAAAQVEAEEYRRRKELALSEARAKSAASGFTATDPTALAIADEIAKYGTLQEQMAAYGGEERARSTERSSYATRVSGESAYSAGMKSASAARKGSFLDAAGTILGSVSTLATRYADRLETKKSQTSYRYG